MRFLLIAYDYPPIPSPQSLRWAYLVRELALSGHDVHVIAPDVEGYGAGGLPEIPETVVLHRVWPGPFAAYKTWRLRKRAAADRKQSSHILDGPKEDADMRALASPSAGLEGLNWKGRLRHRVLSLVSSVLVRLRVLMGWSSAGSSVSALFGYFMFPDERAEWMPWAKSKLDHVLGSFPPDIVITSHEPANSIKLGLHARQRGFKWIADLGDPVLAPYTPSRWRKHAFNLESMICEHADCITVTSDRARQTLFQRHAPLPCRSVLLTQGYDHRFRLPAGENPAITLDAGVLELLYTGSFYAFRNPSALVQAVLATENTRLNIATIAAPSELVEASIKHPHKIRLLGFLPHTGALSLQRRCDVLVNIANTDPVQLPGKLYEYLGSGTPILHISDADSDASRDLILEAGAGWVERNDSACIAARLSFLFQLKQDHELTFPAKRRGSVEQYSWESISERLVSIVEGIERKQAVNHVMSQKTNDIQQAGKKS